MNPNTYNWYSTLIKPTWAPPSWSVLYAIITVTYGTVFYKAFTGKLPWMVALPFALNLVFNFSFTYFQFGLKNNLLASIDILLVVGTLIWALIAIWYASPELRWVVYANIPYLLWGTFATVLQLTITYLNK
jgi:benzodiazapine receptor